MKKAVLMMIMALMSLTSNGEEWSRFRMGVRVNAGVSSMKYNETLVSFAYGIGWIAEFNYDPQLYIQSGVGLENKAGELLYDAKYAGFAEIPLQIGYRFARSSGKAWFIQIGPTFAMGLFGSDYIFDCEVPPGSPDIPHRHKYFDEARRFDVELGGRAGVELSKFRLSAGVNYGLRRAYRRAECHNLTFNIGAAYMF